MTNPVWPIRPLGDLFEISAGKTMSAAARASGDKTPFLRTSNVLWDEIDLTTVDEMFIPPHELREKLLQRGDLLICEGGEIGRAAVWQGEVKVMSFQNHLHRLRPRSDDIDPRFYVYFLQSGFTQLGIFEGVGNKTTIPNLSRNRLAAIGVPQPSSDDQRAIVCVLSRIREALRTQRECVELAETLKRAAMRELFTSGLRNVPQKETEIGPMPENWPLVELKSVFETQLGKMLSQKAHMGDSPRPYLRNKNVQWGHLDLSDVLRMDFNEREAMKFRLQPGDLLICEGGVVGRAAIWRGELNECYYQKALHRIRPRTDAITNAFLFHWLSFAFEHQNLYNIGGASSTIAHLPQAVLEGLAIPCPDEQEQRQLAGILDAIDGKINLHHRKRAALEKLFQSLLHKLMTGEIRVAELDISGLEREAEIIA